MFSWQWIWKTRNEFVNAYFNDTTFSISARWKTSDKIVGSVKDSNIIPSKHVHTMNREAILFKVTASRKMTFSVY